MPPNELSPHASSPPERFMERRGAAQALRARIEKYRAMARMTDAETAKRILELTDEFEQQVREIERGEDHYAQDRRETER